MRFEASFGRKQLSTDSGYCLEANLAELENRHIDAYLATGRARDASPSIKTWSAWRSKGVALEVLFGKFAKLIGNRPG